MDCVQDLHVFRASIQILDPPALRKPKTQLIIHGPNRQHYMVLALTVT